MAAGKFEGLRLGLLVLVPEQGGGLGKVYDLGELFHLRYFMQKPGLTTHPAAQMYAEKKYRAVNQRGTWVLCDPDWGRTSAAIRGVSRY